MRQRRTRDQLRIVDRERAENRVRDNVGLIHATLGKFRVRDPHRYEELYAIGMVELMKADRDYDAGRGYEFSTVATCYILKGILRDYASLKRRAVRFKSVSVFDHTAGYREMDPAVACETWESVRRNSTAELFAEVE